MTVSRISTYSLHQALMRDTTRTQTDLFNLQGQLSSGLKSDTFAGLGSGVEQFADLESRMGRGQGYVDANKVLQTRLDITDQTLNSIINTATDIKNLIALRRNAAVGDSMAYQTQLEGKWKELISEMNVNSEGRYLFSGSATNTQTVSETDFPVLHEDGVADKGYYHGSGDDMSMRIDDNITITYNVRGDDPAFQKIFAGLAMAKAHGDQPGENEGLQKAYDFMAEGVEDLIGVRATVNANKVMTQDTNDRLQSQQLYWKGLKEEISNTDIVAVSTQVAINQGILQASFQAFARISNLKLSDFLR